MLIQVLLRVLDLYELMHLSELKRPSILFNDPSTKPTQGLFALKNLYYLYHLERTTVLQMAARRALGPAVEPLLILHRKISISTNQRRASVISRISYRPRFRGNPSTFAPTRFGKFPPTYAEQVSDIVVRIIR